MSGKWHGGDGGIAPTWRTTFYRNPVGEWTWRCDVTWFRTGLAFEVGR